MRPADVLRGDVPRPLLESPHQRVLGESGKETGESGRHLDCRSLVDHHGDRDEVQDEDT